MQRCEVITNRITQCCNYITATLHYATLPFLQRTVVTYCILRGWIKEFNNSITTILFEVGSYRTVIG